jgi:hypothetical protein
MFIRSHQIKEKINLSEFLYEIRYVLLFYIIGDIITTMLPISSGLAQETNPFLAFIIENFGVVGLVGIKVLYILVLLMIREIWVRAPCIEWEPRNWCISLNIISTMGIFLVINNLMVYTHGYTMIQML